MSPRLRSLASKSFRATLMALMRHGPFSRGVIRAGRCGFFGNMFMTLNGIRMCEAAGITPEPRWDQESLFYDPSCGGNAWEYYFQPIASPAAGRPITFKPTADVIWPPYPSMGVRRSYAELIRRHVRLRPELQQSIHDTATQLFRGRYVIGVHVRQTDAAAGFESRRGSDLSGYSRAIDRQLSEHPDAVIFAATDALPALEQLRERYGDRLRALDAIRSPDHVSIHGHYDAGVPGSPYQKGLEVIRDAYLLARVNHLVRGESRVTGYSLCLNPTLEFTEVGDDDSPNAIPSGLPWLRYTPDERLAIHPGGS